MELIRLALQWYALKARSFEKATHKPIAVQKRVLLTYLGRNRGTAYGKKWRFAKIRTVADYQRFVPLSDCGTMRPYVEQMARGEQNILTRDRPVFFGATSGTTSVPKLIPTTAFSERRNAALMDLWSYYIARDHPDVLRGKVLSIISPEIEGNTPSGVPFGAESGRIYKHLSFAIKHMYALPYDVFLIKDYNARYYTILRLGIEEHITNVAAINPNSLILLCHKIDLWRDRIIDDIEKGTLSDQFDIPDPLRSRIAKRLRPNPKRAHELRFILKETGQLRPRHFWPDLEVIECWKGGTVSVYLKELPTYFGTVAIRDLGCHSTEARSSIPTSDEGAGGVLAIQTNFYEFIPKEDIGKPDKRVLLCDRLETGKEYFIVVTTPGGLYRYNIDDIIRVTGWYHKTPVIEFVQKGLYATSIAGEKLYESQVNEALNAVVEKNKSFVEFFTAIIQTGEASRYIFLVEFTDNLLPEQKHAFLVAMDESLRLHNREYDFCRESEVLNAPVLKIVKKGEYERYKELRLSQGAHDGQFKMPELTGNTDFEKNFTVTEVIPL